MSTERDDETNLERREFIKASAALALAAGAVACSDDADPVRPDAGPDASVDQSSPGPEAGSDSAVSQDGPLPGAARVAEVHDPKAVSGKNYDAARVKAMLSSGLIALSGAADVKQAWKQLIPDFSASMRIGIKVNCLSGYLYNSTELLSALVQSLILDLGADVGKIIVWDRRGDELARSKITSSVVGGAQVLGTIKSTSDSSGPGYEAAARTAIDKQTHLSTILTKQTDVTINLPVLKTHNISGVTGAMKNIYGVIDNPGDFHTKLNDYLPALYALSPIPKHVRLNIVEGLLAVTKGDTADPPDKVGARILLGADPVATDARVLALINELRGTLKPVKADKLKWLAAAEAAKLGTRKVDLRKVAM